MFFEVRNFQLFFVNKNFLSYLCEVSVNNYNMDTKTTLQLIRNGIKTILMRIAPIEGKAILFGSRARGDARQDSDWDVLILLNKDKITKSDLDEVSYPVRELGWEIDAMLNPVMYTYKDWAGKSFTPFYKNVMKEGVAL